MTLAGLVLGLVVGAGVVRLMGPLRQQPVLVRTNFRGEPIATAGGLAIVFVVLLVEALFAILAASGLDDASTTPARLATVTVVLGFGALGLLDDLVGDRSTRGFRGHLGALVRLRPSTGSWKVVGGAAVAVLAAALLVAPEEPVDLLVAAVVIALAANTANLFDLAPLRLTKVAVLTGVPLLALGAAAAVSGVAVTLGATLACARDEAAERTMAGDTGANAIGAAWGVGLVAVTDRPVQLVALGVLVVLNLLAERISFSAVIARFGPLRWLDGLGRRR